MPISNELLNVAMKFECPACGHPIVKNGRWFKAISTFSCDACETKLHLGYADKLALFQKHKQPEEICSLAKSSRTSSPPFS
ncbi:MAG: hypothetical protein E5W93_00765 [Mesorhizobium sp.]|nr:MAG: hypothetical protein E5W93_00765 [Mesorhizobium sp.]